MTVLDVFRFNALMHPGMLLLLAGVAALLLAEIAARPPGALNVSTGETLARIRGRGKAFSRRAPALLRAVGLGLLVVALARPITGNEARKDRVNIVDIMLCVDLSGSMRSMDFGSHGQRRNRLDVTKEAVLDFLGSRKERGRDRYGLDRVGLVFYGTYAWTQCPLTLDYGVLERELVLANVDEHSPKSQRTAIGSAIGLAVDRLRKSEAKSKVIILLTDGLNNAGELDPPTAALLAKEYGIRVYTIGAGATDAEISPPRTLFGIRFGHKQPGMDEEALKKIAETTGAKYYRATDTESLREAYDEVNELEKTEIEIDDYYEHEEGFEPYAIAGTVALLASAFARRLWFETVP